LGGDAVLTGKIGSANKQLHDLEFWLNRIPVSEIAGNAWGGPKVEPEISTCHLEWHGSSPMNSMPSA
jgi:hypothetical protein